MPRSSALARALDDHCTRLTACRRCAHTPDVVPIVSRSRAPRAVLVGQAPGQTETGSGRPFAGRAGRTLFRWFASLGLEEERVRDRVYIAAITRCYPGPHPGGRGDRVPTRQEQAHCREWLDAELRLIRPPLLIPVGRLAIARFLGPRPLDEVVGREHLVDGDWGRSVVVPLPHPSGASSWVNAPEHQRLLRASLALIGARLAPPRPAGGPPRPRSAA